MFGTGLHRTNILQSRCCTVLSSAGAGRLYISYLLARSSYISRSSKLVTPSSTAKLVNSMFWARRLQNFANPTNFCLISSDSPFQTIFQRKAINHRQWMTPKKPVLRSVWTLIPAVQHKFLLCTCTCIKTPCTAVPHQPDNTQSRSYVCMLYVI